MIISSIFVSLNFKIKNDGKNSFTLQSEWRYSQYYNCYQVQSITEQCEFIYYSIFIDK